MLHARGYLAANDGNVSARLGEDRVLVTPSGVHKGFLAPADLVVVDLDGRQVGGAARPTGELALHLRAYAARPDARAVVHAHPPIAIALSLARKRLDGVLPEVTLSIGSLQVVPYRRPLTDALAVAVAKALGGGDAVIMARHGTVAVGADLAEAYGRTERVEHAAQVLHAAYALGPVRPVPAREHRALRAMYERSRR